MGQTTKQSKEYAVRGASSRGSSRTWRQAFVECVVASVLLGLTLQAAYWLSVVSLGWRDPQRTAFMAAEAERLALADRPKPIVQSWRPLSGISSHLQRAVVAAEDSGFVDHEGVEWEALADAADRNAQAGRVKAGGSTLTMQLAKNLYLSGERSYLRKAQELVLALQIEATHDKRRILELYLNVAEWGEGIFGAEAAARHYFGVSAARLSPAQAAWLAAILPSPRRYDRQRGAAWPQRKAQILLRRMPQVEIPR